MAGQPQMIEPASAAPRGESEQLRTQDWDGRARSYIPGPKLRVSRNLKLHTEEAESIHPVTFEVIRNALWIVNQEQADTIRKVSSSPVTTFAFDFNTSIQNETGDGVVFAPYLQYFPGMADLVVRWTIENLSEFPGIHDGDLFVQNDPLIGVSHQMDFQAFAPVFVGDELFCWIFNSIHVRDIGGVAPGSFCVDARDIYSEATPIPPQKIVERGRIRPDIEAALMRHSRMPGLLALDLRSQMAGIHASRVRILDLVRRYGAATVKAAMRKIIRDTSRAVGERLRRLPDGTWTDVSYLGGMYTGDRGAYRVVLSMEKTGDQLVFRNEGTDPQVGSSNCSYGAWRAAVLASLCSMLAWDHRFCFGGVLEHMKFEGTEGTVTCIDRNGAVSNLQAIMMTIFQASKVASKMMVGGSGAGKDGDGRERRHDVRRNVRNRPVGQALRQHHARRNRAWDGRVLFQGRYRPGLRAYHAQRRKRRLRSLGAGVSDHLPVSAQLSRLRSRQVSRRRGPGDGMGRTGHRSTGIQQCLRAGKPARMPRTVGRALGPVGAVPLPIRHRYPRALQARQLAGHRAGN